MSMRCGWGMVAAVLALSACRADDPQVQAGDVVIATSAGRVLSVSRTNTQAIATTAAMELAAGRSAVGLDYRPANRQLYVLDNVGDLYALDAASGRRVLPPDSIGTALNGSGFGFDFNPADDSLRVVSDRGQNPGQNLRVAITDVRNAPDGPVVSFTATAATVGDIVPVPKSVTAAAYSNSFANACQTQLYVLDARLGELFVQDPADTGELIKVGSLGFRPDEIAGFDIAGAGTALALMRVSGDHLLYSVNLATGAATAIGPVPLNPGERALGMTVVPSADLPVQNLGDMLALTRARVSGADVYRLLSFNVTPTNLLRTCTYTDVTGIAAGDVLRDMDVRPSDGKLYALASGPTSGALYEISPATGAARFLRSLQTDVRDTVETFLSLDDVEMGMHFAADPNTDADRGSFDYDDVPCGVPPPPVNTRSPDCLRVLTGSGQNFFVNVDNGNVEASPGTTANAVALAARNRFVAADPDAVTVFAIDTQNRLGTVTAAGAFTAVGTGLGIAPAANGPVAMDINALNGRAFAAFDRGVDDRGTPADVSDDIVRGAKICEINLATGAATEIGSATTCALNSNANFIGGTLDNRPIGQVIGLTASRAPTVTVYGVTAANDLVSFSPLTPNSITVRRITGMGSSEFVVGMDFRPVNGLLYALGNLGNLYLLAPSTAVAVLTPPLMAAQADDNPFGALNGALYGMDFNPAADRLRVISDNEQNLRIRPATGDTTTDGALSPAGTAVAAAYTNNFAGATSTQLLVMDSTSDQMRVLHEDSNSPPTPPSFASNGTLTGGLALKDANAIVVNALGDVAFDIVGGSNGLALAAIQTNAGQPSFLYRVDVNQLRFSCEGTTTAPNPRTCVNTDPIVRDTGTAARIGPPGTPPLRALAIDLR